MRYLVYLCTYSPGFIATVKTGRLQEMAVTIQNLNCLFQIQLKKKSHKKFVKNYHFQCNGRTCYFSPRQIFDFYRHGNYVPWNVAPPREGQQSADWTGCTAQTTDVFAERHSCWCLQPKSCYAIKKPFHEFTQIFNHFVLKKNLRLFAGWCSNLVNQ